jgi:methyltransferase (TIGR00027 family)
LPRTDDDSWDLKTGVGVTATLVAAARAVAGSQTNPVISDPFAETLVRAVGLKLFTQLVGRTVKFSDIDCDWMPAFFGMRGKSFDDFVVKAYMAGVRQAVILASGLDCRAHRLEWPPTMSIYEVDQPQVLEWKQSVLSGLGWAGAAGHHYVGIDLRHDWPTALRQAGFDDGQPTAWIVEGLLVGYLPPEAHDKILDAITNLSAPGSQLAADYVDSKRPDALGAILTRLHSIWHDLDPEIDLRNLTFSGRQADPVGYLVERGWMTQSVGFGGLFDAAGRTAPTADGFVEVASFMRMLSGSRI